MFKQLARFFSLLLVLTFAVISPNVEASAQTSVQTTLEVGENELSTIGRAEAKRATEIAFVKITSDMRNFIREVYTGDASTITGIYVHEEFSLNVSQQPSGSPGYISPNENTATEFKMARDYGSIGMLAHNYLAGDLFFQLEHGQVIYLVFGDGMVQPYTILNVLRYQALQPNSPYSNFLNLDNTEEYLSAADLFYKVYDQDDALILQTCIENQGIDTWGRLFIIAVPGPIPVNSGAL
ncbi:MAG: hypothetical protein GWN30_21570 [Gammaproteobacteria bacterium]|nr:hypothetical protein [Gammaproteobacteria bacterium]